MVLQGLKMALAAQAWRIFRRNIRLSEFQPTRSTSGRPLIFACLHRDLLMAIIHVRSVRPYLLVSNSPDGDILTRTLGEKDYGFVRGATGDGGRRAFVALRQELAQGHAIGLAVDGPKGPFGAINEGVLQLSRLSGAVIVPLRAEASRSRVLATWDRTVVPHLFSRVTMHQGPTLSLARDSGEAELAVARQELAEFFGVKKVPMRIIDWRSGGEKAVTALWRGQKARDPGGLGSVGQAWANLHGFFVARRIGGRVRGKQGPMVISVGNLALGGTGKTPVVIALARDLAAAGVSGAVLTRGYRSALPGPVEVVPGNESAGDEARLLAASLTDKNWTVIQARQRWQGLQAIVARKTPPTVVLLEDGHQTAGVGRELDVLILDHWSVVQTSDGPRVRVRTGQVFPFGPWRESGHGARRAQVWLLETADDVPDLGEWGNRVVTFQRTFKVRPANAAAVAVPVPQAPVLVSGIARPERFEAGARDLLKQAPVLAVRLADHAPYDRRLLDRLMKEMKVAGGKSLVTTAKDWLKIAAGWPDDLPAYVIELTIVWGDGETLTDLIGERLASSVRAEEAL